MIKLSDSKRNTHPVVLISLIVAMAGITLFSRIPAVCAYWIWSPEAGKFVSSEGASQDQAEELLKYALDFRKENKDERAIQELENLLRQYPSSSVSPDAQYQIGIIYEEKEDFQRAFEAYQKLTENYPQSDRIDEVIERLFRLGERYLGGLKTKVAGIPTGSGLTKAVEVFEHIVKVAPYSAFGDRAQFQIGVAYRKMGQFRQAMDAFQKVIDFHPNSALVGDARFQLAECSYEFSKRATRDQEAIDHAIQNISNFLAEHPEGNMSEKAEALKHEIEERDAEKNFGIAAYYESQHEIPSAHLYYEDIVKRYPNTNAGKHAAEKLQSLSAPAETVRQDQQAISSELEMVEAKLKALDFERETLQKQTGAAEGRDFTAEEKRLEHDKKLLLDKQNELESNVLHQGDMLRKREAAWREKRKIFEEKRHDLRKNTAPELADAFARWEASLAEEKKALDQERAEQLKLQSELGFKETWIGGVKVPLMGGRAEPLEKVVGFKTGELAKIRAERDAVRQKRLDLEAQFARERGEERAVDEAGFLGWKATPAAQELVKAQGGELAERQTSLAEKRERLNELIRQFEKARADYRQNFGGDFTDQLTLADSIMNLDSAGDFLSSGLSADESMRQLQQEKIRAGDAWFRQKELVETLSRMFADEMKAKEEAMKAKEEKPVALPAEQEKEKSAEEKEAELIKYRLSPEEQALDRRGLRKRIKFLEREIRRRFDEIEDWRRQKEKTVQELDDLLNQHVRESVSYRVLKPVTFPIRFMLWFMKSATFGLANNDERIVKQAANYQEKRPGLASDDQIRSLRETIELQSIMIQGHDQEIQMLKDQVAALQLAVKQQGGPTVRPVFLERESEVAKESVRIATGIVPPESREAVLIERLHKETEKLQQLETRVDSLDRQIDKLGTIQSAAAPVEATPPVIPAPAASTMPKPDETPEAAASRKKAEDDLTLMKQKIEAGESGYQQDKEAFDRALFDLYKKQTGEAVGTKSAGQATDTSTDVRVRREYEGRLADLRKSESHLIGLEKKILSVRANRVERELRKKKTKRDSAREQALLSERDRIQFELSEADNARKALNP